LQEQHKKYETISSYKDSENFKERNLQLQEEVDHLRVENDKLLKKASLWQEKTSQLVYKYFKAIESLKEEFTKIKEKTQSDLFSLQKDS